LPRGASLECKNLKFKRDVGNIKKKWTHIFRSELSLGARKGV